MQKFLYFYYIISNKHNYKFRERKLEFRNKVSEWLTFIDGEDKERVEKVMGSNSLVKKAEVKFKYLTGDENERRLEELREKARYDRACMIANATERGVKQGIKEEKMHLILSMSKKDFHQILFLK